MRVCPGSEDGLLSKKSAGFNNVIGIIAPYGDGDHINRITGASMGGGSALKQHRAKSAVGDVSSSADVCE